jgi:23S rRNA pseudouridine2605 synthase
MSHLGLAEGSAHLARGWISRPKWCLLPLVDTRRPSKHRRATVSGTGLARALSKLGYCSRSEAWKLIRAGRVRVDGALARDPERRTDSPRERIEVDGQPVRAEPRVYLMLNKPRGLVTTTADERGRETVFKCLQEVLARSPAVSAGEATGEGPKPTTLPRVFPVGRLDRASEGLLLFTNDTAWAARITDPASHLDKTYHVQVECLADEALLRQMAAGVTVDDDLLAIQGGRVLRRGTRNSWLEVVLDEGKNRQIRRLLGALGANVLRLMRVAIGPLKLGPLPKGQFRQLTREEVAALARFGPGSSAIGFQ